MPVRSICFEDVNAGILGFDLVNQFSLEEDMTMSHHYSGPNFVFPRGDARLDLTDLYEAGRRRWGLLLHALRRIVRGSCLKQTARRVLLASG